MVQEAVKEQDKSRYKGRVLVVDDDEDVLIAAKFLLRSEARKLETLSNPALIPDVLRKESYDVILLDMNFSNEVASGDEGLLWLKRIVELDSDVVVIMITAFGDVDLAVQAIKLGATDFVVKPWQNEKLLATVSAGVALRQSRRQAAALMRRQEQLSSDLDSPFQGVVAESQEMRAVLDTITRVASTDVNLLILGENGVGKEVVARSVHRQSSRARQPFVTVDMASLSETVFESELFGHVKGAFTDARSDRAGRFEIAAGSTLFLDEIGNLPLHLQSKLLTALEQRHITRLGSNQQIPIDIRLICATNLPISKLLSGQEFRQDLLYRINTVQIIVPPLRDRRGDIAPLAMHYLKMYCTKYKRPLLEIDAATMTKLQKYRWPGNVRELQHAIERAVILSEGTRLRASDFTFRLETVADDKPVGANDCDLEQMEKAVIKRVLIENNGNISHAARKLGLTRAALYRRMQKYDL